ncbi:MAG: phosphotransferase family protein [Ilumatobacteraceae bacterium]
MVDTEHDQSTGDSLGERLAAWLSRTEGINVEVRGLEAASAGARRFNAVFEAVTAGSTRRLAITMIPAAAIQLLDVRGEAAVRSAAEAVGVPVPHVHHVCPDDEVLGGPFFLSTAVDGETVPRRVLRLVHEHGIGELVTAQLGEAMARLHTIDDAHAPEPLPRPAGGRPLETAIAEIDEHLGTLLTPSPVFSYGARWLERNAPPEPSNTTVVHSDIRTGNIIVGPDGLRAVLDWETSRVGDPMEDLAWACNRMWRFRDDERTVGGMAGIDVLREAYVEAGGEWDHDRFVWWRVLGAVRWGLGLAGQARAHLDGSFHSIVMAASGRRVPELEYDTLLLLRPDTDHRSGGTPSP